MAMSPPCLPRPMMTTFIQACWCWAMLPEGPARHARSPPHTFGHQDLGAEPWLIVSEASERSASHRPLPPRESATLVALESQ